MNEAKNNENRRAIIIGVDEYESNLIPQLEGAQNDAKEVCETFIQKCNFQVPDGHFLLGKKATRKNILKAISETFRKDIKNELVTFYFSGHGCSQDKKGYIAPYDMDPEDPFVSGIEMESIKNTMFNSKNHASVMMILDCCYAGISTETTKSMTTLAYNEKEKDLYVSNLQDIIKSGEYSENSSKGNVTGKIVLASSEPDAVSREIKGCVHLNNDEPHTHGNFSFYLLEGLNGKAANSGTGVIDIYSLRHYVSSCMEQAGRQKPLYAISLGSDQLENIILTTAPEVHKARIISLITKTEECFKNTDPKTNLIDIQALDDASKCIGELIYLNREQKEIVKLKDIVDEGLAKYKNPTISWLASNFRTLRPKLNQIEYEFFDYLNETVQSLNFDILLKSDINNVMLLAYLFSEVKKNIIFESEKDQRLDNFITRLRVAHESNNKKDLK